jgi:hypothetical protein
MVNDQAARDLPNAFFVLNSVSQFPLVANLEPAITIFINRTTPYQARRGQILRMLLFAHLYPLM